MRQPMQQHGGILGSSEAREQRFMDRQSRWVISRMCRNGIEATLSNEEHIARPAWAHAEEESNGDLQNRPL